MTQQWRTVKVFVSSTFRDMQAERDQLVRFVFPRLRDELLKRRTHMVDVDLRWGVTSDQNVLDVCREIIDECRPRFICLLGGRYGWIPPGCSQSITAAEIRYAALDQPRTPRHSFFYLRDQAWTSTMPDAFREPAGSRNEGMLAALKKEIIDAGLNHYTYSSLEDLSRKVYTDLLASVNDEFETVEPPRLDEFAQENMWMEALVESAVGRYVTGSRKGLLEELDIFAAGTGRPNIFILTGRSGIGKTALLANFFRDYRAAHPQERVIGHFIGSSPGSSNLRGALRFYCHELDDGGQIPLDVRPLVQFFRQLLQRSARRLVLIIDGLNLLDAADHAHRMDWIPLDLKPEVRIIVSSLDHPALEAIRRRGDCAVERELQPLLENDKKEIIRGFLRRYRKRMTPEQINGLLSKTDGGIPLYLLAALEELRTMGKHHELTNRIHELPEDVGSLFSWILRRLGAEVGEDLVRGFTAYLGASRYGLSHAELADLVDPGDPTGQVAGLERLLRPYLMFRGDLLDAYHIQFREAMEAYSLASEARRKEVNRRLAEYFCANRMFYRSLSELPYHQTVAGMWRELETILTDLTFVDAKCAAGLTYELVNDYAAALAALPEAQEESRMRREREARVQSYARSLIDYCRSNGSIPLPDPPPSVRPWTDGEIDADSRGVVENLTPVDRLRLFAAFVLADARHLANYASRRGFCAQQAFNLAGGGPLAQCARQIVASQGAPVLLRSSSASPRFNPHPACLFTLEGGLRNQAVAVSFDGRLAVAATDTALRVWDLVTGRPLCRLDGHTSRVRDVCLTPDGRTAVSGGDDETVRIWDIETARCVKFLHGHAGPVNAVHVSPDGRLVASMNKDHTVRVWETKTGSCLRIPGKGRDHPRRSMRITPGARSVVWIEKDRLIACDVETGQSCFEIDTCGHAAISADGRVAVLENPSLRLNLWDLESRRCVQSMDRCSAWGPVYPVLSDDTALSADGRLAVTGSREGRSLLIWTLPRGLVRVFKRYPGEVKAISLSADGGLLVSAAEDNLLRVWNIEHVYIPPEDAGHVADVLAVSLSQDGRLAASGGKDRDVRLWDLETGRCVRTIASWPEGPDWATAVDISPDGSAIAVGRGDGKIEIYHREKGPPFRTFETHRANDVQEPVRAICFTADGRFALSGCGHVGVHAWDLGPGRLMDSLSDVYDWVFPRQVFRYNKRIVSLAVAPDGRLCVAGFIDGTLHLWDIAASRCIRVIQADEFLTALGISFDGRRAVTGTLGGSLQVWQLDSGACLATIKGHCQAVRAASLLDEHLLASASADETVRLWDLETGECVATAAQTAEIVIGCARGRIAAFGDALGNLSFYDLSSHARTSLQCVTPVRLWRVGAKETAGCWAADITALCRWCGRRFPVSRRVLRTIERMTGRPPQDQPPCLSMPVEAWNESLLVSECRVCGQSVRFNPYLVDNRGY
ncbi:MAG: DUF4062 domain-containing protein [Acidobacteria bacterium]|nr:DUF4062 domain-containing protein [Acidobacteriota bacterium]